MISRSDPVMFLILLIASTLSQGLTMVSYGNDFITAFPENVGYFYPNTSTRILRITALHNNSTFTVHFNGTQKTSSVLQSGQTVKLSFPKTSEVHRLGSTSHSIRITSVNDIVVHSFSQADIGTATIPEKSVQSHVVQPITNLAMSYLIPSLNQSDLIQTFSGSPAPFWSQRYSSFKLIIINAENTENTVKLVKGMSERFQEDLKILPYQLIQLQVNDSLKMVESSHKVAVILTHPCLEMTCKCNMIVNQILPVRFQGQNFVVPYIPGITQSRLLMTSNDKLTSLSHKDVQLQPSPSGFLSLLHQAKSQYVKASGNVSLTLISPGLIFEVIPENMFGACYLLQFYSDNSATKKALVIAETASKDNLRKDYTEIPSTNWNEITGTKYSSAEISIHGFTTVIWHPTSKIAVYLLEISGTTVYGGPAIPINTQPDEFGCVAIPGNYEVGNDRLSWAESLAHCTSLKQHLACPTSEDIQKKLSGKLNSEEEEAWIGLRRSLMTTDWYWQRQTPSTTSLPSSSVDYFYWADGQPDENFRGLCASLLLNRDDEYKWKSAKCCEKKRPVCYKPSISFYPLPSDTTSSVSFEFF